MKIGVDLRVLQIGHQYRGIGEVTKQCLDRIFVLAMKDKENPQQFLFYEYEGTTDPKQFLNIPTNLQYKVIKVGKQPSENPGRPFKEKARRIWDVFYGRPVPQGRKSDVFLQFDHALGVPLRPKTVLIAHDLIPLIFWNEHFESPWLHVKHKAARTTLRTILNNYEFKRALKRSHKNADRILCVSENTLHDIHKYLRIPLKKMKVNHLGVSEKAVSTGQAGSRPDNFPTKPFLLFIGGIDKGKRRRVDDIVGAYNNLKAAGHDIQLVLVGENFREVEAIPDITVRKAVRSSSYAEDILTMGYVDDETKKELYEKALAFVFPTVYEGFGIPILEAMLHGCPVITYKNSSIPEVAGKHALYAGSWEDILSQAGELLAMSPKVRAKLVADAQSHARRFTWDKTARVIYQELVS